MVEVVLQSAGGFSQAKQVADDASLIGRSGYLWQELLSHSPVSQATARPDFSPGQSWQDSS